MNYVLKSSTKTSTITVTTLIDNTAADNLESEHGLSLWLEFGDKRVLFDTGQTDMILRNANLLGVNLDSVEAIVISHGHYDHTGGLKTILDIAPKATLYIHPEALKPKYSQKDSKTKCVGMSDSTKDVIRILADNRRVIWTEMPTEIFPGLFTTSQIPRNTDFEDSGGNFFISQDGQTPDKLLDDQAIFFKTKQGLVVLVGCAHAGVVNTLDYISKLTGGKNIYAVIGGMHLVNANLARIKHTIEAFKKYDIQKLVPLHCTGQKAIVALKNTFGEKCSPAEVGTKIII